MRIDFRTPRLSIRTLSDGPDPVETSPLLKHIPVLLSPSVTENLPPYFQGINSAQDAQRWLEKMLREGLLLAVKTRDSGLLIGFVFIADQEQEAHIGYLLGEAYWGQGLAVELLAGLIKQVSELKRWCKLVGGVDKQNIPSCRLLEKLGFTVQSVKDDQVIFYEYRLTPTDL